MRPLILPDPCRSRLLDHAQARAPEECCGILIGRCDRDTAQVVRVVRTHNVDPGDRRRCYTISPRALLAVHKATRLRGLAVMGYYHSHPDQPPTPSPTDRTHAHPGASYVIVGSENGSLDAIRSWRFEHNDVLEQRVITTTEHHFDLDDELP